jgi:hypothetical protein
VLKGCDRELSGSDVRLSLHKLGATIIIHHLDQQIAGFHFLEIPYRGLRT